MVAIQFTVDPSRTSTNEKSGNVRAQGRDSIGHFTLEGVVSFDGRLDLRKNVHWRSLVRLEVLHDTFWNLWVLGYSRHPSHLRTRHAVAVEARVESSMMQVPRRRGWSDVTLSSTRQSIGSCWQSTRTVQSLAITMSVQWQTLPDGTTRLSSVWSAHGDRWPHNLNPFRFCNFFDYYS